MIEGWTAKNTSKFQTVIGLDFQVPLELAFSTYDFDLLHYIHVEVTKLFQTS